MELMNISLFLTYCIAIFVASIIPGPSMMLALIHGIQFGFIKSNYSALGNVVASLLQAIVTIILLLTIGHIDKNILDLLAYLGGAYIIYLGLSLYKAKFTKDNFSYQLNIEKSNIACFIEGFNLAILNPKAIVFFLALFPKFVVVNSFFSLQTLTLLIPIFLIAYICFLMYSVFGRVIVTYFTNIELINKSMSILIILAGILLIIL